MAPIGAQFRPGDAVPHSGIYRVAHDPTHAQEHEVTCLFGKRFPPCRGCDQPRFVLHLRCQIPAVERRPAPDLRGFHGRLRNVGFGHFANGVVAWRPGTAK